MKRMNNGAIVIAQDRGIVLAMWDRGLSAMEYVTWRGHPDGECHNGHYFTDIYAAATDYANRVGCEKPRENDHGQ